MFRFLIGAGSERNPVQVFVGREILRPLSIAASPGPLLGGSLAVVNTFNPRVEGTTIFPPIDNSLRKLIRRVLEDDSPLLHFDPPKRHGWSALRAGPVSDSVRGSFDSQEFERYCSPISNVAMDREH
jgi:hypothetical protein